MTKRNPLFAANWKMNKGLAEIAAFVPVFRNQLSAVWGKMGVSFDVVLAPTALHLHALKGTLSGTAIGLAAQNAGTAKSGAFTGEVAPVMLKEVGVEWVILGHSERRHVFKEDDTLVLNRLKAVVNEELKPILCVGELLDERKSGKTMAVIERQLSILTDSTLSPAVWKDLVIAYEPVWAIGTGENATPQQAQEVHAFIRDWVKKKAPAGVSETIRVLYGGSVKAENSGQLLLERDVDGLLVGGASLDPTAFAGVVQNGLKSKT